MRRARNRQKLCRTLHQSKYKDLKEIHAFSFLSDRWTRIPAARAHWSPDANELHLACRSANSFPGSVLLITGVPLGTGIENASRTLRSEFAPFPQRILIRTVSLTDIVRTIMNPLSLSRSRIRFAVPLLALIGITGCTETVVYRQPGPPPPPPPVTVYVARPPSPPPPIRVEVIPVRPHYAVVWVRGHWRWNGYRWAWIPGHYRRV